MMAQTWAMHLHAPQYHCRVPFPTLRPGPTFVIHKCDRNSTHRCVDGPSSSLTHGLLRCRQLEMTRPTLTCAQTKASKTARGSFDPPHDDTEAAGPTVTLKAESICHGRLPRTSIGGWGLTLVRPRPGRKRAGGVVSNVGKASKKKALTPRA